MRLDVENVFSVKRWDELGQFLRAAVTGEDMVATKSLPTWYLNRNSFKNLQSADGTAAAVATAPPWELETSRSVPRVSVGPFLFPLPTNNGKITF